MIRFAITPDRSLLVPTPTAPRRPASFLFSAAVHGTLLALVAFGPKPAPRSKRPIFDSIIRPNEKKIVWYRKLPEITPPEKIGDSKEPRGEVKSASTSIAMSPKPKSKQQLVLQQSPQIKLEVDLSAPNLIALAAPPPRLPAPKQLKRF